MDPDVSPAFRRSSRSYHVTKDYAQYLHSPSLGRYNPKFERVFADPTSISIVGEKGRFNYHDRNNVHFVKVAEG